MSGLGDALQQIGGVMMNMAKDERLAKLQKEKEERARQDELAKEERLRLRELNKVSGEPTIIERDGKKIYQYKNSEGRTINEEEVDPYTLTRLARKDQKEDLSIEGLVLGNKSKGLGVTLAEKKLEDYDADEVLDDEYRRAQIGSQNRANRGDGGGGIEGNLTPEPSRGALTNLLVKEFSDLSGQYTQAPEGQEPKLTKDEFRMVADEVIASAAKEGGDPRTQFPKALRRFLDLKARRAAVPKRK
jgi:hypothetical protein